MKVRRNNLQLVTRWANSDHNSLVTELRSKPLRQLKATEILVHIEAVPTHGSFWLATDRSAVHPRINEFLSDGEFVFGNGGVGRVVSCGSLVKGVTPGDFVSIFGHYGCEYPDCVPCRQLGRYVECRYGEGKILGHGGGALDGTFAKFVTLPCGTWIRCFKANEFPSPEDLIPLMYSFLVADVRNALSAISSRGQKNSVLLFGAGLSGHFAIALLLSMFPRDLKIIVADTEGENLKSVKRLSPDKIQVVTLPKEPPNYANPLAKDGNQDDITVNPSRLKENIDRFFPQKHPDIIFECSSGDSTNYWANTQVIRPRTVVIVFGFGLRSLVLSPELLQTSGLEIRTSRGVGDRENMAEAIIFIKKTGYKIINKFILTRAKRFDSLQEFLNYTLHVGNSQGGQISQTISYVCPK